MVRITEARVDNRTLTITCTGRYGIGSLGNPSGRVVKECIRSALEQSELSGIVIDFRAVEYEWGDGPGWSTFDALFRGIRVTYLCSAENAAALKRLIDATGIRKLGEIQVAVSGRDASRCEER